MDTRKLGPSETPCAFFAFTSSQGQQSVFASVTRAEQSQICFILSGLQSLESGYLLKNMCMIADL